MQRREFFGQLASRTLGLAALTSCPTSIFGQTSQPAPLTELEAYLQYERQRLPTIQAHFTKLKSLTPRVVPEYERNLSRAILTIRSPKSIPLFRDVVRSFPAYTRVLILVPEETAQHPWQQDLNEQLGRGVGVLLTPGSSPVEVWAQDILEVVKVINDEYRLLLPLFYRYARDDKPRDSAEQLRVNVDGMGAALQRSGVAKTQPLPFFAHGGDLAFDRSEEQSTLFTTIDPIINTIRYYKQVQGIDLPRKAVVSWLKVAFGVDRVEVVTESEARIYTLHMDQNLCLLPDKKALVTKIVDDPKPLRNTFKPPEIVQERKRNAEIRKKMVALGYEVIDVRVSPQQLAESRIPLNGIPFVDVTDQNQPKRRYIMPSWSDLSEFEQEAYDETLQRLEGLGYQVTKVPDRFHLGGGSLHCAVNVVS